MVQPSKIIIFSQLNVDLSFQLCYNKYVGAVLGCSLFLSGAYTGAHSKKSPSRTVKSKRNDP